MLDDVAMGGGGLVTYHSVVFEPNAMRMHVSFSTDRTSAPDGPRSTLDVAKLLERPVGVIATGR